MGSPNEAIYTITLLVITIQYIYYGSYNNTLFTITTVLNFKVQEEINSQIENTVVYCL